MPDTPTHRRPSRVLGFALSLALLAALLFATSAPAETTVQGWGANGAGQLGTGTASKGGCACVMAPQQVAGLSGVTQVAAGREHTLALLSNGTVLAWGANNRGQLGDGTQTAHLNPTPVPGLSNIVAIAAGEDSSVALTADGTVRTWGHNGNGELGVGSAEGPETCLEMTVLEERKVPCSMKPVTVPGLSNVIAVAVGGAYVLALKADGTVVAWGYDVPGTLGDGVGTSGGCSCVATPNPVPGVSGAVAIYAGEEVASALPADGTVIDWGRNDAGGLGTGNTDVASVTCRCLGPVHVNGLSGVSGIASGGAFGMAALANGGAVSWGFNANGELGNGRETSKAFNPCECVSIAGAVSNLSGHLVLAAGEHHGMALTSSGKVATWGANARGQLGIGAADATPHPTPAELGLSGVSAIAAGAEDSFALLGPTHALSVSFAGAGKGVVGGTGLICQQNCIDNFPEGQVAILRGEGSGANGFAGFSGACTGPKSCQVKLDQDRAITATFGVPAGTKITKARIDRRHRFATFRFSAPGAITGFECMIVRPPARRHRHSHRKAKRRKPRFGHCNAKAAYRRLAPGRYTFKVRAVDLIGHDAHPAVRHFRIPRRSARRAKG